MPDEARFYRDYVLGTGRLHHVWELVDRAFALAGFELAWQLDGDDPLAWTRGVRRLGRAGGRRRPGVHPARPTRWRSPPTRAGSPSDLGWQPRPGLDAFLEDMLDAARTAAGAAQ